MKKNNAITLITLVITIIILLILSGITLVTLMKENGILNNTNKAKNETEKKASIEIINLKISNAQLQSYKDEEQMPSLQYLADRLYEDNEIEYVCNESQKNTTSKEEITVTGEYIYTKLKEYPYEFQINSNLQVALVDDVESVPETITITKEEYESLKPSSIKSDSVLIVATNKDLSLGTKKLNEFSSQTESSLETYFDYDTTLGSLTCKKSGWFLIDMSLVVQNSAGDYSQGNINCYVNQISIGSVNSLCFKNDQDRDANSLTIYLKIGDVLEIEKSTTRSSLSTNNVAYIRILKI